VVLLLNLIRTHARAQAVFELTQLADEKLVCAAAAMSAG
jgi:hypothetical protein